MLITNVYLYSINYQCKGWTNCEIRADWIKLFDKETKSKLTSKDEWCLLILDGHNSHYTYMLLEHALSHLIKVLCYPSHIMHLLQGLDVVIFGVFKFYLSKKQDELWRSKKKVIDKNSFFETITDPWQQTFTKTLSRRHSRRLVRSCLIPVLSD
jgi:hypothetical protein